MKEDSRGASGGQRSGSLRNGLVVGQVAISLVLLIGSGLFVRSLISTQSVDPGFHAPEAGMIGLEMATSGYTPTEAEVVFETLQNRLLSAPGIDMVALTNRLPLGTTVQTNTLAIPGYEDPNNPEGPSLDAMTVSPEYFTFFDVAILDGRAFDPGDTRDAANVVVISEEMARRYWQGRVRSALN